MGKLLAKASALVLALAAPSLLRADDDAAAKAIIDKAVKAHGGQDNLAKIKAATWTDKGKFYGLDADGPGIDFTAKTAIHGPTKRRMSVEGEVEGEKFSYLTVVNGDKGWTKSEDEVEEMEDEELTEQREQMFADWTAFVNPSTLESDSFKLSPLREIQVEQRTLVGVRAKAKDRRALNLYFDKGTGLLTKTDWQVIDTEGVVGGGEVQQEVFLSDYKDVNGVKAATKTIVKWAGKRYVECESSEFQFTDKLDDSLFNKPE
jgi:outer membrane lipoprotein-sorting protein